MQDKFKTGIEAARRSFNEELLSGNYSTIHDDREAIARLVDFLDPQDGGSYLDLATGRGAMAFALAKRAPGARIIGIDIADQALAHNRALAQSEGLANLEFRVSDGVSLAFPGGTFDGAAWRYALHHFPKVEETLSELRRVLKTGGRLALADAVRHPGDSVDFINRFQALKPDGHVKMYEAEDLRAIFDTYGFKLLARFAASISFTRALDPVYSALVAETPESVLALYGVDLGEEEAALTFPILNACFELPEN